MARSDTIFVTYVASFEDRVKVWGIKGAGLTVCKKKQTISPQVMCAFCECLGRI
jgi:hypothetical protein